VVPLIYGQPVDVGPTVVEDGADELVELVDDEIEFGVYVQELDHVDGQEPDHADDDGLV
jgi:hypothetical protein